MSGLTHAADSIRPMYLIRLTGNESGDGRFCVLLEYDNVHDRALILDGNRTILAECGAEVTGQGFTEDEQVDAQFIEALDKLILKDYEENGEASAVFSLLSDVKGSLEALMADICFKEVAGKAVAATMAEYVTGVLRPGSGAFACTLERQRQQDEEGFNDERDDGWKSGELTQAAVCYAAAALNQVSLGDARLGRVMSAARPARWPWHKAWWRPAAAPKSNLEKAMALLAAEWDRLDRIEKSSQKKESE